MTNTLIAEFDSADTETLIIPLLGTAPLVLPPPRSWATGRENVQESAAQTLDTRTCAAKVGAKAVPTLGTNDTGQKDDMTTTTNGTTAKTSAPADTGPQIEISRIGTETLLVPLLGTSPLLVHKFSEKSKRQMLDAMQGRKTPKQPKNPEQEYKDAAYRLDDGGYGFPAIALKSATVSGARFFGKSVTMVGLRQCIFVGGEFSRVEGQFMLRILGPDGKDAVPAMREDVVRVGNGGTDLRYRPMFAEWQTVAEVTYVASMLTRESVLSLIEAGGMGVGIGEWRPEKRGDSGTFIIDPNREVQVKPN